MTAHRGRAYRRSQRERAWARARRRHPTCPEAVLRVFAMDRKPYRYGPCTCERWARERYRNWKHVRADQATAPEAE